MPSTGKSEPRGRRFPGEALKKTRRASQPSPRPRGKKLKAGGKVPEERLVGVCAFDAVWTLETAVVLEGEAEETRAK
jgi:hypothetical protein